MSLPYKTHKKSPTKTIYVTEQVLDVDPDKLEDYRSAFKLFDKKNTGNDG